MIVEELIEKLREFPPDAKVILCEDVGCGELEEKNIAFETMNYIEYAPYWAHHPPSYGWEYPSEYKRKVLATLDVVVIS